jgi:hypothetical protein
MTSIFIKTYPKDHVWLQYLLPSIEKYAEGFKEVIIVSDEYQFNPTNAMMLL